MNTVVPVNGTARAWTDHRYVLWFGSCSPTFLMIWADDLESALSHAEDWLSENAPGCFCDEEIGEEYQRALAEGLSEEEAQERAAVDTTLLGDSHSVLSWEWGIVFEDPTRDQIKAFLAA